MFRLNTGCFLVSCGSVGLQKLGGGEGGAETLNQHRANTATLHPSKTQSLLSIWVWFGPQIELNPPIFFFLPEWRVTAYTCTCAQCNFLSHPLLPHFSLFMLFPPFLTLVCFSPFSLSPYFLPTRHSDLEFFRLDFPVSSLPLSISVISLPLWHAASISPSHLSPFLCVFEELGCF